MNLHSSTVYSIGLASIIALVYFFLAYVDTTNRQLFVDFIPLVAAIIGAIVAPAALIQFANIRRSGQ